VSDLIEQIHARAEPYWQTRKNDVHVPMAYDFAQQLLAEQPDADRTVVLAAILLHDNGWKRVPRERQLKAFGPEASDREAARMHELEGAKIAREILLELGVDAAIISEVASIIDGHDTRAEAFSLNDKIVKDADKLWRFTAIGIDIDHRRFGIDRENYLSWLGKHIEPWLFTDHAKQLARDALDQARTAV
jgi:HD superfamily phosphodiesterase